MTQGAYQQGAHAFLKIDLRPFKDQFKTTFWEI